MKKFTTLLLGFCLISTLSFGQYWYIPGGTGNPGGINNTDDEYPVGGGLGAAWTQILGPSVSTPTWSANQNIPFAFNFNGGAVTQFKVSSTGVLTFTTGAAAVPGASPSSLPNASIPDASVCVWGLECKGSTDNINIRTYGTAPNRQQWIFFSSCTIGSSTAGWSYWSIVLEETSDRIYIVDQKMNATTGGITAGIQVNSTTAVDVTGSPALLNQAGNDGTAIDNHYYEFVQGVQPAFDVDLTSLTNLPYAAAGNLNITGVLTNLGANTITTLQVDYNTGAGPQTDNLTGLSIASGSTYNLSHSIPLNVVAGTTYNVNVDVTLTGDANTANNTGSEIIVGLTSIPAKNVVGEEKTGTWCGWCPRGAVGLANMEAQPDFIGIAVHNGSNDPMRVTQYDGNLGTYIPGGYPGGGVDRMITGNPSAANFLTMHNQRKTVVVPCDVNNIVATYNTSTNLIKVSADSEWFGTISGNYRLSCVIVEDDVVPTTGQKDQVNYYSGGGNGSMAFPNGMNNNFDFGATTAPDPVAPSLFLGYDHVAVSLSNNDILGDAGSLPAGSVTLGTHSHTFASLPLNTVDAISNAHAIVMVVNADNGEILNAAKASFTLENVSTREFDAAKYQLNVYPNPTNNVSTLTFNLPEAASVEMEVYNNMGSKVFSNGVKAMNAGTNKIDFDGTNLPSGIYFVNLTIDNQVITKKVSLIK